MRFSSKTIHSLKLFLDLAEHYGGDFVSLNDIAYRKDISKKYLEQIIPLFNNSDLLIRNRGKQGGYKLKKSPKDITLKEIVYISEDMLKSNDADDLAIKAIFDKLDDDIEKYFSNITLEDLLDQERDNYSNSYII